MPLYRVVVCEKFYNYTEYEVDAEDANEAEEDYYHGVMCDQYSKDAGCTDIIEVREVHTHA